MTLLRQYIFVLLICLYKLSFSQNNSKIVPQYNGETMVFDLKIGPFHVGEAEIIFEKDTTDCGSHIIARTKSTGFAKLFKQISYSFESCMDPETGLSKRALREIIEGDYLNESIVYYNHNFRQDSSLVYSEKTDTVIVPKHIPDILAGFYHYRANNISPDNSPGSIDTIQVYFIDEVWPLVIKYSGHEIIKTKYGTMKCMKFMPETEIGRFFKTNEDMSFWVSNASPYVPVKIYVNLRVGSLTADLIKYTKPAEQ